MFRKADLVLLTKIDLLPQLPEVSVDTDRATTSRFVMPKPAMLLVSAKTGDGIDAWIAWLRGQGKRRGAPCAAAARWRSVRMMLTFALVAAAISIGAMHTLAPDHWVPFAALARAERWSARRHRARDRARAVLGHVTVSVALGLLALFFGFELLQTFGERLESVAGLLLIGFGLAYAVWGLHRRIAGHGHSHLFLERGAPPRMTRSTFDEAQVDPEPAEGSHGGARAYPEQDVTDHSAIRGCDDSHHHHHRLRSDGMEPLSSLFSRPLRCRDPIAVRRGAAGLDEHRDGRRRLRAGNDHDDGDAGLAGARGGDGHSWRVVRSVG